MALSRWATTTTTLITGIVAVASTVSATPSPSPPPTAIDITATASATHPHERRDARHEADWAKRARAPPTDVFEMRVGLAQRNLDRGHDLLMDVSDPRSANYGRHWTAEEVARAFAPAGEAVDGVVAWVTTASASSDYAKAKEKEKEKEMGAGAGESGIARDRVAVAASGGWVVFNATVAEAERLLQTEFWLYEQKDTGVLAAGCDEYHVPAHLSQHIDFVYPGVVLAESKRSISNERLARRERPGHQPGFRRVAKRQDADCSEVATPECIAALYNIPAADKAHPNNSMGFFQKTSFYQEKDLDLFFETYAPHIPQGTRPTNLSIDLATWHYNESDQYVSWPDEADLDLDMAYPLIYPQTATVYQVDDEYYNLYSSNGYFGIFNTFLDAIDGSYCNYSAFGETGDNAEYDPSYPNTKTVVSPGHPDPYDPGTYKGERMCGVYQPTNVISMSYSTAETTFTASYQMRQCNEWMKLGLQGVTVVGSAGNSGPLASESCRNGNGDRFVASHPGNCPYITSVGATMLQTDDNTAETVANDPSSWASSGGFSWTFPTPSYQQEAVAGYLANHDPGFPAERYNKSGRGFPDVAALGKNVAVAVLGEVGVSDGTSAATPLFGALISRINEERLAAGKAVVGFLNPVLYANPGAFRDVTTGNNSICQVDGFSAVEGWDPASGLGTPDYPKLLEVFMALP